MISQKLKGNCHKIKCNQFNKSIQMGLLGKKLTKCHLGQKHLMGTIKESELKEIQMILFYLQTSWAHSS